MIVRFCDRCKTPMDGAKYKIISIEDSKYCTGEDFELCPKCVESLSKWFKDGDSGDEIQ